MLAQRQLLQQALVSSSVLGSLLQQQQQKRSAGGGGAHRHQPARGADYAPQLAITQPGIACTASSVQSCASWSVVAVVQRLSSSVRSSSSSASSEAEMSCCKLSRPWEPPPGVVLTNGYGAGEPATRLVLYNSLVDEKVPFVPAGGPSSRQISWYMCGPTVYDSAHMGHARNYVTFDILRRVLEDYFGYSVLLVMNVTDVDDKIILRARRNHLLAEYQRQTADASVARTYALAAVQAAAAKQDQKVAEAQRLVDACGGGQAGQAKTEQLKLTELLSALKGEQHKAARVHDALTALGTLPSTASIVDVLDVAGEYVAEALDKADGHRITDSGIFRAHAARYEREFMEDMAELGCRPPSVLTRVSEYIPEVVAYIERIVGNGMAYASNGSVYFDTRAFREQGHTYGKLKPWAVGSALLACEGEANFETQEKRSPMDFALWKAAKPGEPTWDSPWGPGRPGWHIECSAMASSLLGARMDIHTGGEDLRFPHHDNELAQAEAHFHAEGCTQWVNYFLHSGHLEIEGLKMSKSLKNFVTIRDALKAYTARQLRLLFVLQAWNKPMIYGDQAKTEMKAREAQLRNFFQNVEVAVRAAGDATTLPSRWEAAELALQRELAAAQSAVHAALSDNINTPAAMDTLSGLIKATNVYLAGQQEAGRPSQRLLLTQVSGYVARILSVLGVIDTPADRPGLSDAAAAAAAASSEGRTAPVLDALASFRDQVRALARAKAEPKEVLAACDALRDGTLVDLGVRLEDRPDGRAVWKLDDPAVLREEAAERTRQAAEAAARKLEGVVDRKVKELEKLGALAALPAVEQALADKYSAWDAATGEPTHDKDGVALDGKAKDKARRDVEKARKVREPLAKKLAEDPQYLDTLGQEIEQLRQQLQALRQG